MKVPEALEILSQFEYSSAGDIKRYPSEMQYEKALLTVKKYVQHAQHHLPTSAILDSLLDIDGDL